MSHWCWSYWAAWERSKYSPKSNLRCFIWSTNEYTCCIMVVFSQTENCSHWVKHVSQVIAPKGLQTIRAFPGLILLTKANEFNCKSIPALVTGMPDICICVRFTLVSVSHTECIAWSDWSLRWAEEVTHSYKITPQLVSNSVSSLISC